jgi:adenylate cyclase
LSGTYEKMNRVGDAFDAYKQYIVKRDSVFSLDKARQITSTELSGAFARKQLTDSLVQARKDAGVKLHMQRQRGLIYGGFVSFGLVLLVAFFIYRNYTQQKQANVTITNTNTALRAEKQVSETLLLNILPADVAEELKQNGKVKAKLFDNVTVLMTDFVGFTRSGERLSPEALVAELHTCFEAFDHIVGKYRIEKIKTVGDAYMAVCGLPVADERHAEKVVAAAIEINTFMQQRLAQMGDRTFDIRIGIHSGSLVAGIVGVKKFAYDIWGDTVNTAARMEQHSEAGKINISGATYALVKHKFDCVYRGEIEAKNKGAMKMYFVELKAGALM